MAGPRSCAAGPPPFELFFLVVLYTRRKDKNASASKPKLSELVLHAHVRCWNVPATLFSVQFPKKTPARNIARNKNIFSSQAAGVCGAPCPHNTRQKTMATATPAAVQMADPQSASKMEGGMANAAVVSTDPDACPREVKTKDRPFTDPCCA